MSDETGESDHHLLDDELVDMLNDVPGEDPVLTEYMAAGDDGGGDRTATADGWMPEADEMKDETFISPSQAKALAVGRWYEHLFDEVDLADETQVMKRIFDDFEKYVVSIHGKSREQQVNVLANMFGGSPGGPDGDGDSEATISLISNTGDE